MMLEAVTEKIEGKSCREVEEKTCLQICGKTLGRSEPNSTAIGLESPCRCFSEFPVSIRESSQSVLIQQVKE